jgi:hypothetical protein
LFSLRSLWLKLVQWIVEDLSVVGEEFTHLLKVDLNNVVLLKEFSGAMNDVLENSLENTLVDLSLFRHGGEVWLGQRFHDEILGLSLELGHLWLVHELMLTKEGIRELDIEDSHVVSDLLISDDTKTWHVNGTSNFDLAVAPLNKGLPDYVISSLRNDASDGVGITSKVSLNSLVAKRLNIEVVVATS